MIITQQMLNGEIPVTEEELRFLAENHEIYDLTQLDVSHVSDFSKLFIYQELFNQTICNWDISNCIYFIGMFERADNFKQPILAAWQLSNNQLSQLIDTNFQLSQQHSFEKIGFVGDPLQLHLLFKDSPESPFFSDFNYNAKELTLIKTGDFYGFIDENKNAYQIDTDEITIEELIEELIEICDIKTKESA